MLRSPRGVQNVSFSFIRNFTKTSSCSHSEAKMGSSTVDKAEISHFSNYTEDWWNENGKLKPLHSMNSIRVPFIRDGILNSGKNKDLIHTSKPLMNVTILDVGCGGGVLTESLARLGACVTGLDACKELVECANQHAKLDPGIANNCQYVHQSIEDHNSGENVNKYDAVVASEIVEHVNSHKLFVESCCGVLKPGGSIFFTTMNKTYLSWLGGIIAAENILGIVPKGTHDYEKFIAPHELRKILEDYNCRTKCIHGMFYNFLFNQWYWFPDKSINYALHAVKND